MGILSACMQGEGAVFKTVGTALRGTVVVFMGPESVLDSDTVQNNLATFQPLCFSYVNSL